MSPVSLFAPFVPPPTTALHVGAVLPVEAAAAAAYAAANAGTPLPLPASQSLTASRPPPGLAEAQADGAAMRPDQVFMSRQLVFQQADARTLAASWRTMVGGYAAALIERQLRVQGGALAPALLLGGQDGRAAGRGADAPVQPADAWRFTVHAGSAQAQHLEVVRKGADQPPGRRRRPRAALRLELALLDGSVIAVQVEPVPGGVALELAAANADALERLQALQPMLEEAVRRAGLRVLRWRFQEHLAPAGTAHAALAAEDVGEVLTLPVFRAVAELALVLPGREQNKISLFDVR
ncbi:hypothetical protein [Massilia haematophila]|uniref:Flagellar hook-length control protein FliK n=1 Tax=Massilia haematophila TaxID=457923 RepID=A0ABV7PQ46_9BURK